MEWEDIVQAFPNHIVLIADPVYYPQRRTKSTKSNTKPSETSNQRPSNNLQGVKTAILLTAKRLFTEEYDFGIAQSLDKYEFESYAYYATNYDLLLNNYKTQRPHILQLINKASHHEVANPSD